MGVVVFNIDKMLIAAMHRRIAPPSSILGAKLQAIREGLSWYKEWSSEAVHILSALHVVHVLDEFLGPNGSYIA